MRRLPPLLVAAALLGACADAPPASEAGAPRPASRTNAPEAVATAESAAAGALGAGDFAPPFALPDARGTEVRLEEALRQGPVVLTFYRGTWCPYCNQSLQAFQEALPLIEAAGAQLLAVSPQTPEGSAEMEQAQSLTFPVLSDVRNEVSRDYGLVFSVSDEVRRRYAVSGIDLARINGTDAWELPVPATYVIDTEGTIRYAFVEADYTQRASPREVVEALQDVVRGSAAAGPEAEVRAATATTAARSR